MKLSHRLALTSSVRSCGFAAVRGFGSVTGGQEPLFRGVFPPITTPFVEGSEDVDHAALAHNVQRYARKENGLSGLVVLGSNGEFPFLTSAERIEVLRTAKLEAAKAEQETGHKLRLIAGTGCVSTRETIELTNAAKDLGYDAVMLVTPYYYTNTMQNNLQHHYTEVAKNVGGMPIILYNVPPMAGGVAFTVPLIRDLAEIPNIVGIKDTSGNIVQLTEIVQKVKLPLASKGKSFSVLAGSGSYFFPALTVGADGGVMALANIIPHVLSQLYKDFHAAEAQPHLLHQCQKVQHAVVELNQKITAEFGTPGMKRALDLSNVYRGGVPRRPLRSLSDERAQVLVSVLERTGKDLGHLGLKL